MKKLGRMPLPRQKGGPQGSKKGKKGYTRREGKHVDLNGLQKEWNEMKDEVERLRAENERIKEMLRECQAPKLRETLELVRNHTKLYVVLPEWLVHKCDEALKEGGS